MHQFAMALIERVWMNPCNLLRYLAFGGGPVSIRNPAPGKKDVRIPIIHGFWYRHRDGYTASWHVQAFIFRECKSHSSLNDIAHLPSIAHCDIPVSAPKFDIKNDGFQKRCWIQGCITSLSYLKSS